MLIPLIQNFPHRCVWNTSEYHDPGEFNCHKWDMYVIAINVVYNWLVVLTILKNMKVNGKDYLIYYGNIKFMFQTTNQLQLSISLRFVILKRLDSASSHPAFKRCCQRSRSPYQERPVIYGQVGHSMDLQGCALPVINGFINHSKYRYIY